MAESQIRSLLEGANAAFAAGDTAREEAVLKQIAGIDPSVTVAQLRLATILAQSNRKAEAVSTLTRLLELRPAEAQAEFHLAVLLFDQNRFNDAIPHFERLVKQYPENLGVLACLAQSYQSVGRPRDAVTYLDRALKIRPDEPDFLYARAHCFHELRKVVAAESDLSKALAKAPRSQGYLTLAQIDIQSNRYEEAHENASRALAIDPSSVTARILSAKALMSLGDTESAEREWGIAAANASDKAGVLREKGKEFSSQGMFEAASDAFRSAIQEDPDNGETYYLLASSRRCSPDDQGLVSQMRNVLVSRPLAPEQEQKLCYALGKALDDLGEYGEALSFFDRANHVGLGLFTDHTLSKESIKRSTDAIISRYTAEFIAKFGDQGNPSPLPVFVIGMMRSGTTLVEQLLSAHPLVGGAGEQPFWMEYESEFSGVRAVPFSMQRLSSLSHQYLEILSAAAPGNERVVDKNNCNSYLAGMLAIGFPNAKAIHVQRDPVDTALSIWTTALYDKTSFLCDRSNIVLLLKEHFRLARHWSQVIPEAQYTELRYESLVDDAESEMRRVVAFLGLDWDEACCRPEANQRTVRTPSYWQTRQPIYKRSSQRWRKYEPWLGEFAELLTEAEV